MKAADSTFKTLRDLPHCTDGATETRVTVSPTWCYCWKQRHTQTGCFRTAHWEQSFVWRWRRPMMSSSAFMSESRLKMELFFVRRRLRFKRQKSSVWLQFQPQALCCISCSLSALFNLLKEKFGFLHIKDIYDHIRCSTTLLRPTVRSWELELVADVPISWKQGRSMSTPVNEYCSCFKVKAIKLLLHLKLTQICICICFYANVFDSQHNKLASYQQSNQRGCVMCR